MFACIHIPDFSVEAIVRSEPLLREYAIAILEGKAPLTHVCALNEKARRMGMEVGMTKLQAAIFADPVLPASTNTVPQYGTTAERRSLSTSEHRGLAILRQRSLAQENATHSALLDVAYAFSPRVEDTALDTLLLDLVGLERLYGTATKMTNDLAERVAAFGTQANIALAANPDTAMYAARGFNGVTIIPAGEEVHRLSALPLRILVETFGISSRETGSGESAARQHKQLYKQMLDTLEQWGIRDFRSLGSLPESALASRLGEAGVKLRRLALGEETRTLLLYEPLAQFEEVMELECPVETIESLSFLLNRLLEQLCARLEARALAAQELHLRLQLEQRVADEETTTLQELHRPVSHSVGQSSVFECTVRLPVAISNAKIFLKLLQLDLTANPPGAPVINIGITAVSAPPRKAQRGLFLPITPEPEKLEITLARIRAIVGQQRAGTAHLLDSYRPEDFRLDRFKAPAAGESGEKRHNPVSTIKDEFPLALRSFRPECRLHVSLEGERPVGVTAEANAGGRNSLRGTVLWSAGPWRSSGDWWTEKAKSESSTTKEAGFWDREEWDIALLSANDKEESGGVSLYRIYRDVATGQWFADASYD